VRIAQWPEQAVLKDLGQRLAVFALLGDEAEHQRTLGTGRRHRLYLAVQPLWQPGHVHSQIGNGESTVDPGRCGPEVCMARANGHSKPETGSNEWK
jgi:hypothetical protein